MFERDIQPVFPVSETLSGSQTSGLFDTISMVPMVDKHAHLPAPEPIPEEDDDDDDARRPGSGGGGNIDGEDDEGWSEDDEDDDDEDAASGFWGP